ncbi:MAG TPA: flagellar hook-basal body complex protein FliE [Phycisphaerae bacterium]|nr:flagellar hook-basal body complex protein FliE [Phycisphaerae bacterium]HNU46152.1 flagellar hook-basal body complex protein FliE [Phycisphaerae bacterium]
MVDPIQAMQVGRVSGPVSGAGAGPASAVPATDFKRLLLDSLDEVNRLQQEADAGVQRLATGETQNVAEVLAAVNKAGIAFDLLMQVRNKLLEAYEQVQQMRV